VVKNRKASQEIKF